MKTWPKFVALIGMSLCFLACTFVVGPKTSPSPTLTQTPLLPPGETPTAVPMATRTATPTATPASTLTTSPTTTATAESIDLSQEEILYSDRPIWHELLGWPDDCEEAFQRFEHGPQDEGGISVYPVDDGRYLVIVQCNLGPYWEEDRAYWLDNRAGALTAWPLTVPELIQDDVPEQGLHNIDTLTGSFPTYHPDTHTLTNLQAYRGMKDCGVFYKYHLEDARFVLDEAHYRDCDDTTEDDADVLNVYRWPLVYPPPLSTGPLRKVALLDPDVSGWDVDLRALPDVNLLLVTRTGYATFRDGQWDTQFLDEGLVFVGVDTGERAWVLSETGDEIYYYQSNEGPTPASQGWTPVDHPAALQGRGVVSGVPGEVWLATNQDVRAFDVEQWTIHTREAVGMPPAEWEDLLTGFSLTYVERQQQMWVGSCNWGGPGPFGGGGARWFDGQAWHGTESPVADGCVTAIAADAEGRVWIGMDHGQVWLFDQMTGEWHAFPLPEPVDYRQGFPAAFSLGPDGSPWLLSALCGGASCDTTRALYHLQDGVWVEVAGLRDYGESLLYTGATLPVLFDEAGTPWFFFGMMAFRISENRPELWPDTTINALAATVDTTGKTWVIAHTEGAFPALWILAGDNQQ